MARYLFIVFFCDHTHLHTPSVTHTYIQTFITIVSVAPTLQVCWGNVKSHSIRFTTSQRILIWTARYVFSYIPSHTSSQLHTFAYTLTPSRNPSHLLIHLSYLLKYPFIHTFTPSHALSHTLSCILSCILTHTLDTPSNIHSHTFCSSLFDIPSQQASSNSFSAHTF